MYSRCGFIVQPGYVLKHIRMLEVAVIYDVYLPYHAQVFHGKHGYLPLSQLIQGRLLLASMDTPKSRLIRSFMVAILSTSR